MILFPCVIVIPSVSNEKEALEIAKEINDEVLVTCMHKPSYKQDWFTALPDGRFLTDRKGFKADN